jgi:hypothetical protein
MDNLLLNNEDGSVTAPTEIYFAKVTRFNIGSNTADVVSIDDDISLLNCQIVCSMPAGFAFGAKYVPSHNDSNLETGYIHSPGDIYCIAAFIGEDYNNAVILGFLFPKETMLSIPDYGLYLFRHESDVMWMIRADGTAQMYHPSGSIIKIGSNDSNEMSESLMIPTKADSFNVRDTADYNDRKETNLFIKWHAGQSIILSNDGNVLIGTDQDNALITITKDGIVGINTKKQVQIVSETDINLTATGDVNVNATGKAVINAPEIDFITPIVKINSIVGVTGQHFHSGNPVITSQNGIVTQIS